VLILGIETSCDDTAAAVVEDGVRPLSSVVSSQDEIHGRYGGIVPELASRRHIEAVIPIVDEALSRAGVGMRDIGGIAVTQGPGLVGSILIGLSFAKAVGFATGIPVTGVNHIAAHPMAAFLNGEEGRDEPPGFPSVALVASGGHTTLMLLTGYGAYEVLGRTLDDAAGEAFDKVAKIMGLGYPGGSVIDTLARDGDPEYMDFPRSYLSKKSLDFSFSGLKTSVLHAVKALGCETIPEDVLSNMAASFQAAVVDVLVRKALRALDATGATDLIVAGGVACNSLLRTRLAEAATGHGARIFIPPPGLCSDNGAMIAALGYYQLKKGEHAPLDMNAIPTWKDF